MDTIKICTDNKPLMIAHQGGSGLELGNTNAAFVAAGNRSYFGIETDVHRTIDGKYILFHDRTTAHLAIDDLETEKSTFDTLRKLTLLNKYSGEKDRADLVIPTLSEYLAICRHYEKMAVLDMGIHTSLDLDEICEIVEQANCLDNVLFLSGDFDRLIYLRDKYPNMPLQFLTTTKLPENWLNTLKEHKLDLDICYKGLTKELLDLCHENGIKVNVWTVDDKDLAEELAAWGVDMITTNILE